MTNGLERVELHGTRVLIVDDDADNREMLGMILEQSGAVVTTAGTVAEALDELQRHPCQVLISDIGLPDEDGYALLRKVRALSKASGGGIPAIALTGFAGDEDREQTLAGGFQAHLTKPIALDEMLAAIVHVLRAHPQP